MINENTTCKFGKALGSNGYSKQNTITLYKLVNLAPICVTMHTPTEIVIDLFRKMGVSAVIVTDNGYVSMLKVTRIIDLKC